VQVEYQASDELVRPGPTRDDRENRAGRQLHPVYHVRCPCRGYRTDSAGDATVGRRRERSIDKRTPLQQRNPAELACPHGGSHDGPSGPRMNGEGRSDVPPRCPSPARALRHAHISTCPCRWRGGDDGAAARPPPNPPPRAGEGFHPPSPATAGEGRGGGAAAVAMPAWICACHSAVARESHRTPARRHPSPFPPPARGGGTLAPGTFAG